MNENEVPAPVNTTELVPEPIQDQALEQKTVQEDPFAKGRERMAKMSGFFSSMKEKAKTMASSASDKISKFWDKSKKFGGETVAAVLSADVLADKFDKYTDKKAEELGQGIGNTIASGIHEAKKWNQVIGETNREMVADLKQDLNKVGDKIIDTMAAMEEWQQNKADKIAEIIRQEKDLAAAAIKQGVEKTKEGFNSAKEDVVKLYTGTVEFGKKTIESGKMKFASIKENYRNRINERRLARIAEQRQREMDTVQRELDAAAAEASTVLDMEKSLAERKKQLAEELEEKIELLKRLKMAA